MVVFGCMAEAVSTQAGSISAHTVDLKQFKKQKSSRVCQTVRFSEGGNPHHRSGRKPPRSNRHVGLPSLTQQESTMSTDGQTPAAVPGDVPGDGSKGQGDPLANFEPGPG